LNCVFSRFIEVFTLQEAKLEATFHCTASLEPVFDFADFSTLLTQFYRSLLCCYLCVSSNSSHVVIFFSWLAFLPAQ
jgi:hypothetical protein